MLKKYSVTAPFKVLLPLIGEYLHELVERNRKI